MSDPGATRPLPPARVLPPPSVPPGYYGQQSRPERGPHRGERMQPPKQQYPQGPAFPGQQPGYQSYAYQQYGQPHPQAPAYGYSQPQWGYGGWVPGPPPRRRGSGRLVLGLVGISAVVFFALILVSAINGTFTGTRNNVAVDHSPARASNPNASPVDSGDTRAVLENNTLYQQGGLVNGDCPAQELGAASGEEQTRFYEALMTCLNNEWRPAIKSAGYGYTEPGLVVFDAAITTPCGTASPEDGRTLAFYCPSDRVMYADVPQMRRFFGSNDVAYAVVIGHEFGHHVQQEIGLLTAFDDAVYDEFENRLELNRRVELQASCMGGLFLGAIAQSYPVDEAKFRQLSRVSGSFGDEPGGADTARDHGSGVSNREWIMDGFTGNDLDRCNTFSAPSDEVD